MRAVIGAGLPGAWRRAALIPVLLSWLLAAGTVRAQTSLQDLNKLRANPLAGLRNVSLTEQVNVGYPRSEHVQSVLTLQGVWPVDIGPSWELILFPQTNLVSQADTSSDDCVTGLSDTVFTAAITPRETGLVIWGVGPALQIPTATNAQLGSDLWALGPALGIYVQPGEWTIGALTENVWSFAGAGDQRVNTLSIQYVVNRNLPENWFVESSTTILADWTAGDGQRWTVPVGGGLGRVFELGGQSLSASGEAFYNAARPASGPDWSLSIGLQWLLPG